MKIYLASPLGFAPSTKGFLQELKSELGNHGHKVIDPWDEGAGQFTEFKRREGCMLPLERAEALRLLNHRIGEGNRYAIEGVDVVVAVLDGSDVDSGTASEIGFAFALGKIIVGYRGDIRLTGENEATLVNLQVQYWIEESGGRKGRLVKTVPDLLAALDTYNGGPEGT
jgi:nucleoside 2-deoxyribosyltransferase